MGWKTLNGRSGLGMVVRLQVKVRGALTFHCSLGCTLDVRVRLNTKGPLLCSRRSGSMRYKSVMRLSVSNKN